MESAKTSVEKGWPSRATTCVASKLRVGALLRIKQEMFH